eukprot:4847085-Amphidinium_carterae.2
MKKRICILRGVSVLTLDAFANLYNYVEAGFSTRLLAGATPAVLLPPGAPLNKFATALVAQKPKNHPTNWNQRIVS